MKSSIQWKIVGIYLSVVLVIMIASGSLIIIEIENQYFERVRTQVESTAKTLRDILLLQGEFDFEKNRDEMINTLKTIVNLDEKISIYILDGTGKVQISMGSHLSSGSIAHEDKPQGVVNKTLTSGMATTTEWRNFLNGGSTYQTTVEHAFPIKEMGTNNLYAIIYVVSSADEIYENVNTVTNTLTLGSILGLGIAALFSSVFAKMITRPIKELTVSSKMLAEGAFTKIPIASQDEIGQLTQSFNYMATELSRTMRDISSEKNKLERILENMADGVMAFNRQGVLIRANSVCYDLLEQSEIDHRFDYIFPQLGVNLSFDAIFNEQLDEAKSVVINVDDKFIRLRFATYASSNGHKEGLTVVMQDVTAQQKLDQMRKDFVANVSHELRTPLTTVKSYTETLLDGAIDNKEIAVSFLTVMEKEADRMTMLVQDLLELSRIDNKQMQLNIEFIDIKELVEGTIEAQLLQAELKGHELIFDWEKDKDYYSEGDSARLRQIFHNIISNAIKYSPEPDKISIKLYKGRDIVVQVQDHGLGISKQDLERIFERFYRVDKARSREMGGTGLGLSIAKEMIELHGGRIKVASKLGKGTTVTMYFKSIEYEW